MGVVPKFESVTLALAKVPNATLPKDTLAGVADNSV
jgi:hypothetical protein